jgi:spore coat protein U-like protein
VTLAPSVSGNQTMSGTLGSAGTLPILVGGSFPLASTTALGTYTGSFSVTVTYN